MSYAIPSQAENYYSLLARGASILFNINLACNRCSVIIVIQSPIEIIFNKFRKCFSLLMHGDLLPFHNKKILLKLPKSITQIPVVNTYFLL